MSALPLPKNKSSKCLEYFKKYSISVPNVGIGEWKHMAYGETYHFKISWLVLDSFLVEARFDV